MRKKQITILSLLVAFIFTATVAFAAPGIKSITTSVGNPIPTGGAASAARIAPASASTLMASAASSSSCVAPSSLQLAVCFALIRVGKADVDVVTTVTEKITTLCINPGGNQVPGKNPVIRTLTVSQLFHSDKNGNVSGTIITPVPGGISAGEAGCPNGNWTATAATVDFHGQPLDFSVNQNGALVIDQSYTLP